MKDRERRLGRGLDSLISAARDQQLDAKDALAAGHQVQDIPIDGIKANPFQPRKTFPVEALNDLAESLRTHGLMQPIILRQVPTGYEIVAGERRWRAAQELGWERLQAVVIQADERKMIEWALVENIQRENLGPLELAASFQRLMTEFGLTQAQVARVVGMSRPSISNTMRLQELPGSVKDRIQRGAVSMGAARALLSLKKDGEREDLARRIEEEGLSVRDVERITQPRDARSESSNRKAQRRDPNLVALESEFQETLGSRVEMKGQLKRGRCVISWTSAGELDRLIARLRELEDSREGEEAEQGARSIVV